MSFWKKRTTSKDRQREAEQKLSQSDKMLMEARAMRATAESVSLSLRDIRARNHITPSLFPDRSTGE